MVKIILHVEQDRASSLGLNGFNGQERSGFHVVRSFQSAQ